MSHTGNKLLAGAIPLKILESVTEPENKKSTLRKKFLSGSAGTGLLISLCVTVKTQVWPIPANATPQSIPVKFKFGKEDW